MGGELNYRHQLLDEICLEGLDGITLQVGLWQDWWLAIRTTEPSLPLQALWVRLAARADYSLSLEPAARAFLWTLVHALPQVSAHPSTHPGSRKL